MSEENGGAARSGNDEVGGKRGGEMIEAALDGVAGYPGRYPVATDRAKDLREGNVEVT